VLVEVTSRVIEVSCRIIPRSVAVRQVKQLRVVRSFGRGSAGAIQVSHSCVGRILDECGIVQTSACVVSAEVEIVVVALSTLVRLHLGLEAVVVRFARGSKCRGGNGCQGEESGEVVHVGRFFWRESISIVERL
jgi:hypothetical protein